MDELRRYPVASEKILSPRFFSAPSSEHRGVVDAGAVIVFGCKLSCVGVAPPAGIEVQSTRSVAMPSSWQNCSLMRRPWRPSRKPLGW